MMAEQRDLEATFETLVTARAALMQMPNKAKFKENQERLHEVAEMLCQSTKTLCRNLKDNPNVSNNMLKVASERSRVQALLSRALVEVEGEGTWGALTSSVAEDSRRERLVAETIKREKESSAEVKALRALLVSERAEHAEEMRRRAAALAALKEKTKALKAKSAMGSKATAKEAAADVECLARVDRERLRELGDEIAVLHRQIEIERNVHETSADFLRRRHAMMVEKGSDWSTKYENDTQAKDKEIEALKYNHQRDLVKLKELEEKYQQEMAEKEVREAEDRRKREAAAAAEGHEEQQQRAACKIQALYRGWKVRQASGAGKKGKKGKGKK